MSKLDKSLIVFFQDTEISSSLEQALRPNFELQRITTEATLLPLINQARPTVIVCARRPTHWELLKHLSQMSEYGLPLGLVLLAATYSFEDERKAFGIGLDHYLLAASPTESLVVRINALHRKVKALRNHKNKHLSLLPTSPDSFQINIGSNLLSIEPKQILLNDRLINLPPKQIELLRLFLSNESRNFSREDLIRLVWRSQKISLRSVDAQISKLKANLPFLKDCLKNSYGHGYSFERPQNEKQSA